MSTRMSSEPSIARGDFRTSVSLTFGFWRSKPLARASAFYKGESQEKYFTGDWRERRCAPGDPAQVMLRGSGGFLSLQIHFVIVTTLPASDANKQCGCEMPTMVLSETRGL